MTKEELKDLESQRGEIDKQIRKYYEHKVARKIAENEKKFIGKTYKKEDYNGTTYYKVISALGREAPYKIQALSFRLPINTKQKAQIYLNPNLYNPFDYSFVDKNIVWIAERLPSHVDEISSEEFEEALANLYLGIKDFGNKKFLLADIYEEDYEEE